MEKTAAGIPKNEAAAGEVNADPILRSFPPFGNFQKVKKR
jgi:hypothetical protein